MGSVDRIFDVLDLFSTETPTLRVEDVSQRLGYTRATSYRCVKALTEGGLIAPAGEGTYALGPRVLELRASDAADRSIAPREPGGGRSARKRRSGKQRLPGVQPLSRPRPVHPPRRRRELQAQEHDHSDPPRARAAVSTVQGSRFACHPRGPARPTVFGRSTFSSSARWRDSGLPRAGWSSVKR